MTNRMKIKGEHHLNYNLKIWKKNDGFYILKNISEYFTLVPLIYSLGNVNHDISIVEYWVFYSNYDKSLCLTQESSVVICSPSVGEEQAATFQSVFYAVRYIWEPIRIFKG